MRIPLWRVYRAFPELDPFEDERCVRFVRSARRGWRRQLGHGALVLLAAAPVTLGCVFGMLVLADRWKVFEYGLEGLLHWRVVPQVAACLGLACLGPMVGAVARDALMRRRLVEVIRARGVCPACSYSLIGLAVAADFTVQCPECGDRVHVDPSLAELAGGGANDDSNGLALGPAVRRIKAPEAQRERVWWTPKRVKWLVLALLTLVAIAAGTFGVVFALHERAIRTQVNRARVDAATLIVSPLSPVAGVAMSTAETMQSVERASRTRAFADTGPLIRYYQMVSRPEWLTDAGWAVYFGTDSGQLALHRRGAVFAASAVKRMEPVDVFSDLAKAIEPASLGALGRTIPSSFSSWGAKQVAYVLAARLAMQGDRGTEGREEFLATLDTALTYANLLQSGTTTHEVESGMASETVVLGAVRSWMPRTKPDRDVLAKVLKTLMERPRPRAMMTMINAERIRARADLAAYFSDERLVREGSTSRRFQMVVSNWKNMVQGDEIVLGTYAQNVDAIQWLYTAYADQASDDPWDRHSAGLQFLFRTQAAQGAASGPGKSTIKGKALGLILEQGFALGRVIDDDAMVELERRGLTVMLALELHRLKHGTYPEKLDELVAGAGADAGAPIAATDLIDPMSGERFRYVRKSAEPWGVGYLLYSVGRDLVDDQAIKGEDGRYKDVIINDPFR